jgi:hypothetical protein
MGLDEKSKHAKLYSCLNVECRVIMFKHGAVSGDSCPQCGHEGLMVRRPVGERSGIRG